MKTGSIPPFVAKPELRSSTAGRAAPAAEPQAPTLPVQPDFTNMTKADYVAWGKSSFAAGRISLDDLFQVQFAGGDFDGTVKTDTAQHDFVSFFQGLIQNEVKAGRADKPKSMVPAYQHVLGSMAARFDRSV